MKSIGFSDDSAEFLKSRIVQMRKARRMEFDEGADDLVERWKVNRQKIPRFIFHEVSRGRLSAGCARYRSTERKNRWIGEIVCANRGNKWSQIIDVEFSDVHPELGGGLGEFRRPNRARVELGSRVCLVPRRSQRDTIQLFCRPCRRPPDRVTR